MGYLRPRLIQVERWVEESNETTNLTYRLTDLNVRYLTAFVAQVTGFPYDTIEGYVQELLDDRALADHVRERTLTRLAGAADPEARYGRRLAWYAILRATKPEVVVETGIEKGLGACVLTAALRRNAHEGRPGRYFGTDIDPNAGALFGPPYSEFGELLIGDSIALLAQLDVTIDVFVNDSDHSAEYERQEYETVEHRLSRGSFVIGDNAHSNDELLQFAHRTGRAFLFFREQPAQHWYPGAGVGVAFESRG